MRQVVPAGWVQTTPAIDPVHQIKSGIGVLGRQYGTHLVSSRPISRAGGPYDVLEGGTVTLAGTAESPLGRSIVAYEWDLDYDFVSFDVDATGPAPTFSTAGIDGPAARTVALRVRDSAGETSDASAAQVNVADAPPMVTAAEFLYAQSPHRIVVAFSEDVGGPGLHPSAFSVVHRESGVPAPQAGFGYDAASRRVTLQWTEPLPDGNYQLTVGGWGVRDEHGQPLAADYTFGLFVLAGDANGDRIVDFKDLVVLAQNYNAAGKTLHEGDFDYDGIVGFSDLVILAQRYNTSLPLVPSPAPANVTTAAEPQRVASAVKQGSSQSLFNATLTVRAPAAPKRTVQPPKRR